MTSLIIFLILLVSYTIESMIGFGGAITSVALLSSMIGLQSAVTLALITSGLLGLVHLLRKPKDLVWKEYGRIMLYAGIGTPLGLYLSESLPQAALKLALGLFTLLVGLSALLRRKENADAKPKAEAHPLWLKLCLFAGGIMQGAFGTGGPLVIVYAKAALPRKDQFLATLFAVWLTMNTLLLGVRWRTNLLGDLSGFAAVAFAGWALGITTGAFLSKKINEQLFTKIVNLALVAIGIFMVLQNGKALLGI